MTSHTARTQFLGLIRADHLPSSELVHNVIPEQNPIHVQPSSWWIFRRTVKENGFLKHFSILRLQTNTFRTCLPWQQWYYLLCVCVCVVCCVLCVVCCVLCVWKRLARLLYSGSVKTRTLELPFTGVLFFSSTIPAIPVGLHWENSCVCGWVLLGYAKLNTVCPAQASDGMRMSSVH